MVAWQEKESEREGESWEKEREIKREIEREREREREGDAGRSSRKKRINVSIISYGFHMIFARFLIDSM